MACLEGLVRLVEPQISGLQHDGSGGGGGGEHASGYGSKVGENGGAGECEFRGAVGGVP